MFTIKTISDLQSVLLKPPVDLMTEAYYVIRDNDLLHGPEPNITVIPPHTINNEFPKTFGHYHEHNEPETYRVLYGKAGLLIQKPLNPPNSTSIIDYSQIEEVRLLQGSVGDTLEVPPGFGHCLINLSDDLLVTADWESENAGHIYQPIQKLHGFCYYIVEENGKPKAIKNNNYQKVPDLKLF